MADELFLFVNRSCTGCKGAMAVVGNSRYLPHVTVLAMGEPAMWSDGNSEYRPGGGQGGQVYNRGTRPIIDPATGEKVGVMAMMHYYGVNTVPTMVLDPSDPRSRKLAGAMAILGEMQRRYPTVVAPSGRITTQTPGLAQFDVEFNPKTSFQAPRSVFDTPSHKQIGNIGSMGAWMVG